MNFEIRSCGEAIFIYSFTVVQCFSEKEELTNFYSLFPKEKYDIKILVYKFSDINTAFENILSLTKEVHLFTFYLDKNPICIIQFIKKLKSSKYANYPIILFSKNMDNLSKALYILKKPFQPAILPLNQQTSFILIEYVQYYYNIYKKGLRKTLVVDIPSCFYRIKIDHILFIEAQNKKVSICTKDNQITEIPITFHDILKKIPKDTLIQSHRSYIINPNNVTRINKEAKHWIASFYNTDKKAFISRSYMKNALNITTKKKKNL